MSPFTVPMSPEEKHAWLTAQGFTPVLPPPDPYTNESTTPCEEPIDWIAINKEFS